MKTKAVKPVRFGDKIELEITTLAFGGDSVGRYQDFAIFVPGGLPGEKVTVQVTQVKDHFAVGKITGILRRSTDRVEPPCPIFEECGGCHWQHFQYPLQLQAKRQFLVDALERIGKMPNINVQPCLPSPSPYHYRNKAMPVLSMRDGHFVAGIYEPRSHKLVPYQNCPIQADGINELIQQVLRKIDRSGLTPYQEKKHSGFLRHLAVRRGEMTGEILLALVTRSEIPEERVQATGVSAESLEDILPRLARELMAEVPSLVGVLQNINPSRTNIVFGSQTKVLAGRDHYFEEIDQLRLKVSLQSFLQVNTAQADLLHSVVREALGGPENGGKWPTTLDLYSGIGTLALGVANECEYVVGIEEVGPAVEDAKANLTLNGKDNIDFLEGDVAQVLLGLREKGLNQVDAVIVDPPRKGVLPEVLARIGALQPQRIVYVSCDPSTLARDLSLLVKHGYAVDWAQPLDMFPQTYHVETVVRLNRVIPRESTVDATIRQALEPFRLPREEVQKPGDSILLNTVRLLGRGVSSALGTASSAWVWVRGKQNQAMQLWGGAQQAYRNWARAKAAAKKAADPANITRASANPAEREEAIRRFLWGSLPEDELPQEMPSPLMAGPALQNLSTEDKARNEEPGPLETEALTRGTVLEEMSEEDRMKFTTIGEALENAIHDEETVIENLSEAPSLAEKSGKTNPLEASPPSATETERFISEERLQRMILEGSMGIDQAAEPISNREPATPSSVSVDPLFTAEDPSPVISTSRSIFAGIGSGLEKLKEAWVLQQNSSRRAWGFLGVLFGFLVLAFLAKATLTSLASQQTIPLKTLSLEIPDVVALMPKGSFLRYEMVPFELKVSSMNYRRFVNSHAYVEVLMNGKPVTLVDGHTRVELRKEAEGRKFSGNWPVPFNPRPGTYLAQLVLVDPDRSNPRVFQSAFTIPPLRPSGLDPGYAVLTMEGGKQLIRGAIPSLDASGTMSPAHAIDWTKFMGANVFCNLVGDTSIWERFYPQDFPFNREEMENGRKYAQAAHAAGIKYAAYMTTFKVEGDGWHQAPYQFSLGYDLSTDQVIQTRFISLDDPKRQQDILDFLQTMNKDSNVDFVGLDYVRTGFAGYELVDEFVKDLNMNLPEGFDTMAEPDRIHWLAHTVERNTDPQVVALFEWWRAHKVAMVLKNVLDQAKMTKPVFTFTLGWEMGHQHGQDPAMLVDAGINFNHIMLYEGDRSTIEDMKRHWPGYLSREGGMYVPGEEVDFNMVQKSLDPPAPEELYNREVETFNLWYGLNANLGMFWHDLYRLIWGVRGPYSRMEWAISGGKAFTTLRQEEGLLPVEVSLTAPKEASLGAEVPLTVDIHNPTANTIKGLILRQLDTTKDYYNVLSTVGPLDVSPGMVVRVKSMFVNLPKEAQPERDSQTMAAILVETPDDSVHAFDFAYVKGVTGTSPARKPKP